MRFSNLVRAENDYCEKYLKNISKLTNKKAPSIGPLNDGPRFCIIKPLKIGLTIRVKPSTELNIPSVPPTFSLGTDLDTIDAIETLESAETIERGLSMRRSMDNCDEKE
ncbi:hypothetical protein A4H02_08030 [Fervidobacterium thailandense]|uniref:Uncharacterized protein n=1 Tax=Fervidobacterium thailandense TaxID=1008305 RepID=A0A1E3G245_9BACT|nr:hypothetical protein A4H02_08030 [Fervidobacterium thailandense]